MEIIKAKVLGVGTFNKETEALEKLFDESHNEVLRLVKALRNLVDAVVDTEGHLSLNAEAVVKAETLLEELK